MTTTGSAVVNATAAGRDAMVEAVGLSCGYGSVAAVRDVDLVVRRGEVVALLGPNGAGKSTILRTIVGLLAPIAGLVRLHGRVVAAPLHRRAQQGLAYVPEERSVFMSLTAAENLRLGQGRPARALELFPELEPHLGRQAGLLSGGQQQILTLARALASEPRILVADELSLGLAPLIVERLLGAVRVAAERGVAVLIVEQHVDQACKVADRAYLLQHGCLAFHGTPADLAGQMQLVEEAYLTGRGQAYDGDGRRETVSPNEPGRLAGPRAQRRITEMVDRDNSSHETDGRR